MKKAFITGITGQDGSYLAELLLLKGYQVHGLKRRSSSFNTSIINHIYEDSHLDNRNLILHYGDLTDSANLISLIQSTQPDEIYSLGWKSRIFLEKVLKLTINEFLKQNSCDHIRT